MREHKQKYFIVNLFLSQHLKRAKGNSEIQFSHLVNRTYIAAL